MLQGTLVTWQDGVELGREQYRDDGHALVSELALAGVRATVFHDRATRRVRVASGGAAVEREVPRGTLALENGCWQAYALALEDFPDATSPTPVRVLVPGQGALVDATLTVRPSPEGGREVVVALGAIEVTATVSPDGAVTRVAVPAQRITVRPAADVPPAVPLRPPPDGVEREPVEVVRGGVPVRGELWRPADATAGVPVVVMIAGSGPTDRDCNNVLGLRTDAFRLLAGELARRGVASLRYDKRGVGASGRDFVVADVTLADFVEDARAVAAHVRADARLGPLTVLGHSEGGLIALLLAQTTPVDALVLVATGGRPLAAILREQLARMVDAATLAALDAALARVRAGEAPANLPPALAPLFPPAVVAFLRSALDVDPVALARAVAAPVTVVQGEHDAQVSVADARALGAAREGVRVALLPETNHVLKREASPALPQASYADPSLPLAPGVVDAVLAGVAGASPERTTR